MVDAKKKIALIAAGLLMAALLGGCHSVIRPLHPSMVGPPWSLAQPANEKISDRFDAPVAAATAPATAASEPAKAPAVVPGAMAKRDWLANAANATVKTVHIARYTVIWNQSLNLVQRLGYRVNWQNRALGIITTFPRIGPQIMECWRADQTGADSAMESTFNTFRRSLRIVIKRLPSDNFQVSVEVLVERRENPTESLGPVAFTGISAFGASEYPLESSHLQPGTPERQYWLVVGHDPALEKKILHKLFKHI